MSNSLKCECLVSVIVPVYKVEPYIRKCLDSIIGQTHRNIEIILVDDGTPDACGNICDEYAGKDNRVFVIHQENKGLSGARNAALEICKGNYITFVDSDDFVDEDYVETLLRYAEEDRIVCCGNYYHIDGRVEYSNIEKTTTFSKYEALKEYCELEGSGVFNYISDSCWNKIYPRHVFSKLRFPANQNYEDMHIVLDSIMLVDRMTVIENCLYHYCKHEGTITQTYNEHNRRSLFLARLHQEKVVAENEYMLNKIRILCIYALINLIKGNVCKVKNYNLSKDELEEYRGLLKERIRKTNNIAVRNIIKGYLLLYTPFIFRMIVYAKTYFLSGNK